MAHAFDDLDEGPPHRVFLGAYEIDRTEVTSRAYGRFVAEAGHRAPGFAQNPAFNGPDSGALRVCRGGAWNNGAPAVRAIERGRLAPEQMGPDIGFRCCR